MTTLINPSALLDNFRFIEGQFQITTAHLMKHLGYSFASCIVDANFDTADEVLLSIVAPAAEFPRAHCVPIIFNDAAVKLDIIENPDSVTEVDIVPAINDFRGHPNTAKAVVQTASAFTLGDGVLLKTLASGTNFRIGGDISRRDEYILQPGIQYVYRAYDSGAENATLNMCLTWYEDILHLDRDE